MYEENEIDTSKLKYVLYARKSTDDPQRQVRSIEDQISECRALARRLGLHIVTTIQEKKSAKKPNQRPQFTQMLKDIRNGKYDGIIAWNPDRLARNMKEGGEIIDMVDENLILDMKFVTHHFSKDANGKMLLGIAFVLSKQYSDKLSQDVTRGVRKRFQEGKSATPKHGYIKDERDLYIPDGVNFDLMREGLIMRSEGVSIVHIVNYLNNKGYSRTVKSTGRKIKMNTTAFSEICRDPFYYGILIQVNQSVDLREIYDFQPAIDEETFFKIQQLSRAKLRPFNKKYRTVFYPLRGMILCSFCNHTMVVGPSTGSSGKKLLYYRCDNKLCSRKKKSIRAKIIFDYIYDLLKEGLNLTEKEYKEYYANLKQLTDINREKIRRDIHIKEGLLKVVVRERKERSLKIISYPENSTIWQDNNERIGTLTDEEIKLKSDIANLRNLLSDPEEDEMSLQEFLNLSKNAATIVKSAHVVKKDIICRNIFLNFIVNEEKVLSYQAKEPFITLLKTRKAITSRGAEN